MQAANSVFAWVLAFLLFFSKASAQYTVQITINDDWYESQENYGADLIATIYHDGSPISNSGNYYYEWHVYFSHNGYWEVLQYGNGLNEYIPETIVGTYIEAYVVVTDQVNHTFTNIQSATVHPLEIENNGWTVVFSPLQQNGGYIYGTVTPNHWRWTIDQWKSGYSSLLMLNNYETIQSNPNYSSWLGQKLQYWNGNQTNVVNYNTFYITMGVSTLQPQYWSLDGTATITTSVLDAGNVSGGTISFMDPWLVDQAALGNVKHSEGMSAPYISRPAPFHPDLTTSFDGDVYNGLFLNKPIVSGQPYYSVGAPAVDTINGHAAFFAGWTCSPSGSASFQDATACTTAVVFNNSGATVTAQYKYYTVTYNTTVPSGTYSMAGTVTVPSGVTLTTGSSTTLSFPSGGVLLVKGKLTASGTTYSFSSSASHRSGVTLSHADNSSLTSCTITGADLPLAVDTSSGVSVSSCTIGSSNFSSSQAIRVSHCSPEITGTHVTGGSGSSNGMRYQDGASGDLTTCYITSCGLGNGIVIQGNSNPTISGCYIDHNFYYGIIVNSNGSAIPEIENNVIAYNGGSSYTNLIFLSSSTGVVTGNALQNGFAGIGSYGGSYPSSGPMDQVGGNIITGNSYGILCAEYGSSIGFGSYNGEYSGTCNEIHDNTSLDVNIWSQAVVTCQYAWWGQDPPNTAKFYYPQSYEFAYTPWLSSETDCPIEGGERPSMKGRSFSVSTPTPEISAGTLLQGSVNSLQIGDYGAVVSDCQNVLSGSSTTDQKHSALVRTLNAFLQTGDTTLITYLRSLMTGSSELSEAAEELLVKAYAATGQLSSAENMANDLISRYPGTEIEKRALLLIASFGMYSPDWTDVSAQALASLRLKFAGSLDEGLIAALSTSPIVPSSENKREEMQKATVVPEKYGLENYPNPFNPTTQIRFALPKDTRVSIRIYDMLGGEVQTLVDGMQSAGFHEVSFDGSRFASGVYFYRLMTPEVTITKKMLMTK